MAATALAGRVRERRILAEALAAAVAGRGSIVAITGEAGIGKTTLASAAAADAVAAGFAVARGRCDDSRGAPPFWPWAEVLRTIAGWFEPRELDVRLGSRRPKLGALVPAVVGDQPPPGEGVGSEDDRFLLFDAAMTLITMAADRFPLLVIVEDVHVADLPSLALLEFVSRRVGPQRIVVVITYRDIEARLGVAVEKLLQAATAAAANLSLRGLDREAVAELVGAEHAAQAHDLSGGNPLIAQEVARSLAVAEDEAAVTGSLRSIVARRLELLAPGARELVVMAAVVGMDFDLATVATLTRSDSEEALRRLGEAMRAGVVAEGPFPSATHRFRHSLIRDAIYQSLEPVEAARRHAAIAATIRGRSAEPAAVAHHALRAAAVAGWRPAVAAARTAAASSLAFLGAEDAVRLLDEALALVPPMESAVRLELLLELGAAAAIAQHVSRSASAFAEAEDLARSRGDVEALARVALGAGTVPMRLFGVTGNPDASQIALLEEVLDRVPADAVVLRVKLMTRLAGQLWWAPGSDQRRATLAGEAAALARGLGDPELLANALMVQYTTTMLPPCEADAVAIEAIDSFRRSVTPALRSQAECVRFLHALNHGDLSTCRAAAAAYVAARERHEPSERWAARCFLLTAPLVEGRLRDAEELLDDIAAEAEGVGGLALERSRVIVETFRMMIARRRGGTALYRDLGPLLETLASELPGMAAWLPAAALCFCWTGDVAGKRLFRDALAKSGEMPRDIQWLSTLMLLADGCAFTGSVEHARALHHHLLPYAGWQGNVAMTDSYGPVDRSLGTLEAVMGRYEDAQEHFERALESDRRLRARPSLIQTCLEYGRMLRMRGSLGDEALVGELVDEIRTAATYVGVRDIDRKLEVYDLIPTAAARGDPSASEAATASLRRSGDVWEVSCNGSTVRLRHSKGMDQLARLISDSGREIHVLDLASGGRSERERAEVAAGAGSSGPLLDEEAKTAYRRRVEELRAEVEDADACADLERAARAKLELQLFLSELSNALGFGGRDRPVASSSERARVAVTKTLRTAIDRISEVEPTLGAHLRSAVSTGVFCCYRPDPTAAIRLVVEAGEAGHTGA